MDAQKVQACAIDAEKAVLGSILLDPFTLSLASDIIKPDDFYAHAHQAIFLAMQAISLDGKTIDPVQVYYKVSADQYVNDLGGISYIMSLMNNTYTAARIEAYCEIVLNDSKRRKINELAGKIALETMEPIKDTSEYAQGVKDKIDIITKSINGAPWVSFQDSIKDAIQYALETKENGKNYIMTGFDDLDAKLLGLQGGSLTILAARPGMGKTALALNIVKSVAIENRHSTAFFTLEMTARELATRFISSLSGVDSRTIKTASFNDTQWEKIFGVMDRYKSAPLIIDETAGISISALRDRAKRMHIQHNIEFLVVDYLQLMTSAQKRINSREQEVSDISKGLKNLAKELNIPVLCLSQLNRAVESRTDKRPFLSDLRESGSIEQDADNIIFIHRKDYYEEKEKKDYKPTNEADIIIAKQRAGSTGTVILDWDGPTTTFTNHKSKDEFY